MGQKINPNIFRLGKTKEWDSRYFEIKPTELPVYTLKDLEIKHFIEKFFKNNGLELNCCKIYYYDNKIDIFASYFLNKNTKSIKINTFSNLLSNKKYNLFKNIIYKSVLKKKNVRVRVIKKFNYLLLASPSKKTLFSIMPYIKKFFFRKKFLVYKKKSSKLNLSEKFEKSYSVDNLEKKTLRINILKHYKNNFKITKYQKIQNGKMDYFLENFIEILNKFTDKKLNYFLTLKQLNKNINKNINKEKLRLLKKNIAQLRKYKRSEFFNEGINILFSFMKENTSANLLAKFISKYLKKLKRHNFFLRFIKQVLFLFNNKKLFNLKKIKIKIRGRLNGAPRAKQKIILIGNVPVLSLNTNIDYAEKISFTSNGTLGIKVWTYKDRKNNV